MTIHATDDANFTRMTSEIEAYVTAQISVGVRPTVIGDVLLAQGGSLKMVALGRQGIIEHFTKIALSVAQSEESGHG